MIAIDGSALFAVLLGEGEGARCKQALSAEDKLLISAGSLAEILIVAMGKGVQDDMRRMLDGLEMAVMPLTEERANAAAAAYRRWGKGFHAAGLNICDCFAYALAIEHGCPLLFVGEDFAKTDVARA